MFTWKFSGFELLDGLLALDLRDRMSLHGL